MWARVQDVGKFREKGQGYFDRTWEKAAGHTREEIFRKARDKADKKAAAKDEAEEKVEKLPITNAETIDLGDDKQEIVPLGITEILDRIAEKTGGWPRCVNGHLFVVDATGVDWLDSPPALFGYLQKSEGPIHWTRISGATTKEELFAEMRRTAKRYHAIDEIPHEPPFPNHYYPHPHPVAGNGEAIANLLDRFSLETDVDRQLLLAAYATLLSGGPAGMRPAFMFTCPAGRGKGKTKAAEMLARPFGGVIDVSPKEEMSKIKTRLLSSQATNKRVCLLDNVKSTRFSWGELEALITAETISGHALYEGEGTRPKPPERTTNRPVYGLETRPS